MAPGWLRLIIRAYPRPLRREYGDEMAQTLAARWRDRPTASARLRLIGDVLLDLLRCRARRLTPRRAASLPLVEHANRDGRLRMFVRDLRLAARQLRRDPLTSTVVIATLTLAIGANAAVFSVVEAVLLKPLPYANPDRLVAIWERNVPRQNNRNVVSPANFLEWQDRATSFSAMAAFAPDTSTVTGEGSPEELRAFAVTWDFFDVLGVRPAVGRTFVQQDSLADGPRVVLLSWELWQRRYHADWALIGRPIVLDGLPRVVAGILPSHFRFLGNAADVWTPFRPTPAWREPHGRGLRVIARLKPQVSVQQAQIETDAIAATLERQWPSFDAGWRTTVATVREDMTGRSRVPLLLLLGAVGIVLLVGCANTANLLLARASRRRRELAVRTALGASRARLVEQLLAEGLVLAAAGVAAGLAVARLALAALLRLVNTAAGIPRLDEAGLSAPVLLFSLGLMAVCALWFSIVPALHVGGETVPILAAGGRWSTSNRLDRRVREWLVVLQVALTVVLVIGGGLVSRSLVRLMAVSPGFDPNVFTFTLSLPSARYADGPAGTRFLEQALAALRAMPGVERASGIAWLPFTGMGGATTFTVVGAPLPAAGQAPVADIRPIAEDYFATMGIPLERGRSFTADEVLRGPHLAVVSEALARQLFQGQDPVGRRLNVSWGQSKEPDQIIGIAADVKHDSLAAAARPTIYFPFGRASVGFMTVVLRSPLDDRALQGGATAIVQRLDRDLPLTDVHRLRDLVSDSLAPASVATILVSAFAVVTLALALVGVGALLATLVATRLPEFGIRLALGATPGGIRRLVLGRGAWLVGLGLAAGVAGALACSRLAEGLLYGTEATDLSTYFVTTALVGALALVAADVPARAATRADPAGTLK